MELFKYPRTPHLPWSKYKTEDDRVLTSVDHFVNQPVVVTEKLDGENTTMYRGYIHARSRDSLHHPSRNLVKALHATIQHEIPEGWRIVGENVYAQHSLRYDRLTSYFYVIGIYDENNICFSWQDTLCWCDLLKLEPVPLLYSGIWDEEVIRSCHPRDSFFGPEAEGYVVRFAGIFHYDDFENSVAKFVRADHVTTSDHWLSQPVVPNKLRDTSQFLDKF